MRSHPSSDLDGARPGERRGPPRTTRRRPLVHRGVELCCSLAYETKAAELGYRAVAGLDEVGRGALCGPVLAGAVILGPDFDATGIDDSKRLTVRQRNAQAQRIRQGARAWCLGQAEPDEIDSLGIVPATHLAMARALEGLGLRPDLLLIDGVRVPSLEVEQWPLIKGDALSVTVAAASIIAKVARDEIMQRLSLGFPDYGIERNKGYGSREHRDAILRLGLSPIHRRSFCSQQLRLFEQTPGA